MGTDILIAVGRPLKNSATSPDQAVAAARRYLENFDRCLSRFKDMSELSKLNRSPAERVQVSKLLVTAVAACLWAARVTKGLVDPTLTGAIRELGYERSRAGMKPASLPDALAAAPQRRSAQADIHSNWQKIALDPERSTVTRPVGTEIDSGGIGKGLAADALANLLQGYDYFVTDCGGDIRVGGSQLEHEPQRIEVAHPLTGKTTHVFSLQRGGIATSGIGSRVWRREDDSYAHHLIDPKTKSSAWTGVISATALAPTTLEAETLAKAALLSGPEGAEHWLGHYGGLFVHDSGEVQHLAGLGTRNE